MAKFPTFEEMCKRIAEEALDGYIYEGKTLREWIDILAQTRWIPVSEEIPEPDKFVLVHLSDDYNYDPIHIMSLHLRESTEEDDTWVIYWKTQEESIEFDAEDVIAWMPLPQPYKESEE